jgi:hypothetical protein
MDCHISYLGLISFFVADCSMIFASYPATLHNRKLVNEKRRLINIFAGTPFWEWERPMVKRKIITIDEALCRLQTMHRCLL